MKVDRSEVEQRVQRFEEAARKAGLKLTHQRLQIFREVAASAEHPNAETVLVALKPRMPTVSLDTVYRTLWLLEDLGLVTTLGPRHESVRFDANLSHHHHYVCVRCGLTRDFESPELNRLSIPPEVADFGRIDATQVEVRGVCSRCMQEDPKPADDQSPAPNKRKKKT